MAKISEWLQTIEDPEIRANAIEAHNERVNPRVWEDEEAPSLSEAIYHAFYWDATKQGYEYWAAFRESISPFQLPF